jgi:bacterioferritin
LPACSASGKNGQTNLSREVHMKGDPKVIQVLNDVLTGELTAINQYFLHARMCKAWGYERIADKVFKESIDEMKHAQAIMDRVLFLGGLPNVQKLGPVNIGQTVPEQYQADLELEMIAIPRIKDGIKICYDVADHGSRELLEGILVSEEEHVDWLEAQLELIQQVGKENYLAEQIRKGE